MILIKRFSIYKNMNKICTSIEQSRKLIDLGIDINTADMLWTYDFMVGHINGINLISELLKPEENDIPAWSLTALMKLIPPGNILLRDALSGKYKCINTVDSSYYDNPLDAAFEMVCLLKENGKI